MDFVYIFSDGTRKFGSFVPEDWNSSPWQKFKDSISGSFRRRSLKQRVHCAILVHRWHAYIHELLMRYYREVYSVHDFWKDWKDNITYTVMLSTIDYWGLFIQLFQLRLSPSKAEKSNTSAKDCWESLINSVNFLALLSSLSRSYSTFPLCSGTTLIEIAVWDGWIYYACQMPDFHMVLMVVKWIESPSFSTASL
jgi:hypothetical protein